MKKTYKLSIKDEAKVDISDAFYWYEEKQKGLGIRFIEILDDCFYTIENNPKLFARKYDELRQAIVRKFPYVVIYEIEDFDIIVYSVFNTSQNPEKWLDWVI